MWIFFFVGGLVPFHKCIWNSTTRIWENFYAITNSQMISLWSNIAVKCMYNFAMMCLMENKRVPKMSEGERKLYMVLLRAKLFLVMMQGTFSVQLPPKMYRNDISTFQRKVFNILIFLSKQHVHMLVPRGDSESFSSSHPFLFVCVWCLRVTFFIQQHNLNKLHSFFTALRWNYNFYSNFNHIFVENRKKRRRVREWLWNDSNYADVSSVETR